MDRGHQAQGPAQADPAAGGAGPGASRRDYLAVYRRHRRSVGAERAVQPLLAAHYPAGPIQQHRFPFSRLDEGLFHIMQSGEGREALVI